MDEEDLLAATQGQLKRTRPEFVNYAKRAKRVDVRKLKENIWKSLDIVVDHQDDDDLGAVSALAFYATGRSFHVLNKFLNRRTSVLRKESLPIPKSLASSIRSLIDYRHRIHVRRWRRSARASVSYVCSIWLTSRDSSSRSIRRRGLPERILRRL